MNPFDVRYVRLERKSTNSWITFKLPHPMSWKDAIDYAEQECDPD